MPSRTIGVSRSQQRFSDSAHFLLAKVAALQGSEAKMLYHLGQLHFGTIKDEKILKERSFQPYKKTLEKFLRI